MIGPDGVAPPVPSLLPGEPPLAILVDYDGTIALTDVSDTVMAEHVPRTIDWESEVAAYDAFRGLSSSRFRVPPANAATIFMLKAGRSSGLRLLTRFPSTCTSSSTQMPPALRMSV